MVRGNPKRGRKRKSKLIDNLSNKQKRHLQQFGELHPADEKPDERIKYKKVEDLKEVAKKNCQYIPSWNLSNERPSPSSPLESPSEASSEEEEAEESSSYQKLISSLPNSRNLKKADNYESDEEEEHLIEEKSQKEGVASDEEDSDGDKSDVEESGDESVDDDEVMTKESDPFSIHFEVDLEEEVAGKLMKLHQWQKRDTKIPVIGQAQFSTSEHKHSEPTNFKEKDLRKSHVKAKLCEQVALTNKKFAKTELTGTDSLNPFQHSVFSILNSYKDFYFPEQTFENQEKLRLVYCLHALNHVLKTRSRVIAHNEKIKSKADGGIMDDHRDQGLTRPKVLIVVPFRDSALRIIDMMTNLLMTEDKSYVMNKKRFHNEYGVESQEKKGKKPEDYEALFSGNIDDHFRVGLGIAKKSLKIYTDFYSSDIIVASPLGLRTVIGAEGEDERDYDFLTSIEVLIFDQADVFLMQNWDHILHLLQHLHLQPKEAHGTDFSRVRMWTLDGWSKLYRQTVILSSLISPELTSLFNKHCHNYAGKIMVPKNYISGTICQVVAQLPQVFHKFEAAKFSQCADARFQFFTEKVLPEFKDAVMAQTLVFIPSYFDYVRLRNYFKNEGLDFVQLSEYSKTQHISRSRNRFFHKKVHFMFYTERLHFYRRFAIRGARHLIFYELPQRPMFYSEICNVLQDPRQTEGTSTATCTVLYSQYDAQRLAAVVGMDRAARMVNAEKSVHMLVTGEDSS